MLCLPLFVKKPEKLYMYEKKVGKLFGYLKYFAYFCSVKGKQQHPITPRLDSPSGELNNKIIMATRSCVIIKVRPEDIGKMFKFDTNKLPKGVKLDDWLSKDLNGKVWQDERGDERSEQVELKEVYIGIYCHNDGYINGGVGDSLKAKFNDYETARNLIVGGFCSAIEDDRVRHYANRGRKD